MICDLLQHGQISVLVGEAILEEFCMASVLHLWGCKIYQIYSNDDPRMIFDLLQHGQISVLVGVGILEEFCMASILLR